jgi:hypothetical protein
VADWRGLRVATVVDGVLRFEQPQRLVVSQRCEQQLVEFGTYSLGADHDVFADGETLRVNVVTTADHRMFVRSGRLSERGAATGALAGSDPALAQYKKVTAADILQRAQESIDAVRFATAVPLGTGRGQADWWRAADLPFVARLGLCSEAQVLLFLKFYGFWTGDGALVFENNSPALKFGQRKQRDLDFLAQFAVAMGLVECDDWSMDEETALQGTTNVTFTRRDWAQYFAEESAPAKAFFDWVFNLPAHALRAILDGLLLADGDASPAVKLNRVIYTSSVEFRDQVLLVGTLAGFAATFSVQQLAGKDVRWAVLLTASKTVAEPLVALRRDAGAVAQQRTETTRTWCFDMGDRTLITRRAMRVMRSELQELMRSADHERARAAVARSLAQATDEIELLLDGKAVPAAEFVTVKASRGVVIGNCSFDACTKALGKDNFTQIPNGVNGIEDRMAIVWTNGVKKGVLTPQQFVAATSANAAKLFNLYPRKGRIAVGSDADLVVWDGDATRVVSAKTHHHKVDFNIFEGMSVSGIALYTVSRGNVVWENGTLKTTPGAGRYVPRPCFGEAFAGIAASDEARDERKRKVERAPYTGPVFDPKAQK